MSEGKRTEYVVLRSAAEASLKGWVELERVTATSAKVAVAQVVKDTGEYVAVPARSFQPVEVTVAQKATLSFGEPPKPKEPNA